MNYIDQVKKEISKRTGLTGVESGHIARDLERGGIDPQAIDWETIGQDLYGHGKGVGSVRRQVKSMYGVNLGMESDDRYGDLDAQVFAIQEARTPRARAIDDSRRARNVFHLSSRKGVKKWIEHPNLFDIEGVDD